MHWNWDLLAKKQTTIENGISERQSQGPWILSTWSLELSQNFIDLYQYNVNVKSRNFYTFLSTAQTIKSKRELFDVRRLVFPGSLISPLELEFSF